MFSRSSREIASFCSRYSWSASSDDSTCARGAAAGLDGPGHLLRADSGTYLEECGDLLHTGPTDTNVGDLVLGLKDTTR